MLDAEKVISELSSSLNGSIQSVALISNDGTVLESREKAKGSVEVYSQHGPDNSYTVDPRMLTKLYALFAAHLRKQMPESKWAGAEVNSAKLVVRPLAESHELLVLIVSDEQASWTSLQSSSKQLADALQDSTSADFAA